MATVLIYKQLTITDIKSCLSYPASTLWAFPMVEGQTAVWFQARDPTGKVWNFELSIRPRGYRKPVIRGDWLNYVREKGLTVNDVIVLTKDDIQNGVTYHVKVEPDLRLTLKTFSSAYEILDKKMMMAQDTRRVKDAE